MPDFLIDLLRDLGLLALPLVTQIVTATTAVYTAWRAVRHGLPALTRRAAAGWRAAAAYLHRPSRRSIARQQQEAFNAKVLGTLDRLASAWALETDDGPANRPAPDCGRT